MTLQTNRLKLREFTLDDREQLAELLNNIEITKFLAVVPHPYDEEDAEDFIELCKERAEKDPRTNYNFAIEKKETNDLLGSIGVNIEKKDKKVGELGYWLGEQYWQQGYMTEALQKILELGFDQLGLRRIEAKVYPKNEASKKLLKKFDFKREGIKRKAQKSTATDKVHDEIVFGLLKENFNA